MEIITDDEAGPTQWCVVIDQDSGELVQIHRHIGAAGDKPLDEREMAHSALNSGLDYDTKNLEVIYPDDDQTLDAGLWPTVVDGRIEMIRPELVAGEGER